MNKSMVAALVLGGLILLFSLPGLQAYNIPQEINMNASECKVENPIYAPVVFPHQKHLSLGDCTVCHHKWKDRSKAPKKCTSSGCHDLIGAKGPEMTKVNSSYYAFHSKESDRSCKGCHMNRKEAGKSAGPTNCTKCHPQKGKE